MQNHPPGDAFRTALARNISSALLAHLPPGAVLSVQATVVEGCVQFMALTRTLLGGVPAAGPGAAWPQGLAQALHASLPPDMAQGEVRVCFRDDDDGPAGAKAAAASSGSGAQTSQALCVDDLRISYVWPPCLVCGPPGGQAHVEVVLEPRAAGRLAAGAVGVRLVAVQGGAAVADVQAALPAADMRVRWAAGTLPGWGWRARHPC